MVQTYKDRYGNVHSFDTENEKCGVPGCDEKVAAITLHNMKYSKMYCERHLKGVEVECKVCQKKMVMSCSDFMSLHSEKPRCKSCQLLELNKTQEMREQARALGKRLFQEGSGMFSEENREKAMIASHTPEVCKMREQTKRDSGFFDEGGGYNKGLQKRVENGSLERWKSAGQTSEAHGKQNVTRWKRMSPLERMEKLSKLGAVPSFETIDGVLHYFDQVACDYAPWEEYKERFINAQSHDFDESFKVVSTFRNQDSETWTGARDVFEQSLLDLHVVWFVYVKFYIDKNDISKPLVVGKTGSRAVNAHGSDVDFGEWNPDEPYEPHDTPARHFLYENGLQWDKTKIAVLKCESEQEAYGLEKDVQRKYHLFYS